MPKVPVKGRVLAASELKARRMRLQMSQTRLAQALGVSANTVARWERGELGIANPERVDLALRRIERGGRRRGVDERMDHVDDQLDRARPVDIARTRGARHNLPAQLTSFIGREHEVAQVLSLVKAARLLTLTGAGGIGKTRLALQVSSDLSEEYSDGLWFVDLTVLSDPSLVAHAFAAALSIPERSDASLVETLVDSLRAKCLLLVVDNCEHVVEGVAAITDQLLRECPNLRMLTTSREPVGIAGEVVWQVPPLSLPIGVQRQAAGGADAESEATRLFIDRARQANPSFSTTRGDTEQIDAICRRLDGLPLAIELAAAWTSVLTAEQVRQRLDASTEFLVGSTRTAPARHQTIDAAIRWSYDLLTREERTVFSRACVFAGGFSLDAAEAVCGGGEAPIGNILVLLRQLVAKSLLIAFASSGAEMRYRVLEPMRQFGLEELARCGDAPGARTRHAQFYIRLARGSSQVVAGGPARAWDDRLMREYDNLHAGFQWCMQSGDIDGAQLAGAALAQIWRRRGYPGEGRALLAKLVALPVHAGPTAARASLLIAAGLAAQAQGDFETATTLFEECADIAGVIQDSRAGILACNPWAEIATATGDFVRAEELALRCKDLADSTGDEELDAVAVECLALVRHAQGDTQEACSLIQSVLPLLTARGWSRRSALAHQVLAAGAAHHRRYREARHHLDLAVSHWTDVSDRWGLARCKIEMARLAIDEGNAGPAIHNVEQSLSHVRETGDRWTLALALEVSAAVQMQPVAAAQLCGAASVHRLSAGTPATPRESAWLDSRMRPMRSALGETGWRAAARSGEAVPLEAVLRMATLSDIAVPRTELSRREMEVAMLVARGWTDNRISQQLVIGRRTVESHVSSILRKLGFTSRGQVAAWAASTGQLETGTGSMSHSVAGDPYRRPVGLRIELAREPH